MSCSTFLLRQPGTFLIGHNLDAPYHVPGVIVRNPCGSQKTSISFFELASGQPPPAPPLQWTSTYGSVTFNPMGLEFPDGGINEAGLYVQEMSLLGTRFPIDQQLPRMFMAQWIQYVLDTCQSVAEVQASIGRVALDGWEWHFFVADRSGTAAAIDFFDGQAHCYTDASLPIPALCNGWYPDELAKLTRYSGFGGQQTIELKDIRFERFVHAADLLRQAPQPATIADAFAILEQLERGSTQWSHVVDMQSGSIAVRTAQARQIKIADLTQIDFSAATSVQAIDIDLDRAGDVTAALAAYSAEYNQAQVRAMFETADADGGFTEVAGRYGETLAGLIQRVADYPMRVGVLE
jgi:choloylglycine hydrolase